MATVRTRDEAIASIDRALRAWAQSLTGILTQANAVVGGARAEAEQALRRCAARVASLEHALSAADAESRKRVEAELARARESNGQARRAAVRIADVEAALAALNRAHATSSETRIDSARGQLAAMARGIERYRNSVGGVDAGGSSSKGSKTPAPSKGDEPLAILGLSSVDVAAADLADTPIVGEFGRGGMSRSDYRWAVQTWSDTVGPGISKGMTRDDFAARDARNQSPPRRRTADVYDLFTGTDRIRVDRRPDGSLNVVNGRHRLRVARDLGIESLPGQVS